MNAILMNMSANLPDRSAPSSDKPYLQQINDDPETASDEMCTFLAVNTSSLTLIPTTVVAMRATSGSTNPAEIVGTTLIATFAGFVAGIITERFLRRFTAGKRR